MIMFIILNNSTVQISLDDFVNDYNIVRKPFPFGLNNTLLSHIIFITFMLVSLNEIIIIIIILFI